MNEETFWSLISSLDWDKEGDDEAVMEPAISVLSKMSVEDIQDFQEILARKLHALDTERHAREIGEYAYRSPDEDFSVDYFLYVRCCVVANGKEYYESALGNPRRMPKDKDFESLLYLADYAHKRKTGKELDFDTTVSFETYSNRAGWQ